MMLNKSLIPLLSLALLFSVRASAQSNMEDVIYMKDGGILRGEIIECTNGASLKIKTAGRNVFVIAMDEVKEIRKEKIPVPRYFKERGYVNHTGIDVLPGRSKATIRFRMENGYQFNSRLSAGLGIGFVLYNDPLNLIPLYLNVKYKLMKANTTPFVFVKGGRSFSILSEADSPIDEHSGGFMLNTGFGLQIDTKNGYGWYINAGYNLDHSNSKQQIFDSRTIVDEISYKRLMFGLGLTF